MRSISSAPSDPPPPRASDRRYAGRHCCHASAKDRRGRRTWSGEHGVDATGRSRVDRPAHSRRKPPALCGQPAGHYRPAVPNLRGPGQDGRLKPSLALEGHGVDPYMGERARPTRHVSVNPLGFVTLSPAGRRSNRSSQRFSPSPSANSSRNKIAGLRGPPLRSGPRKRGCSAGFRTGFFRVTEGNTLT